MITRDNVNIYRFCDIYSSSIPLCRTNDEATQDPELITIILCSKISCPLLVILNLIIYVSVLFLCQKDGSHYLALTSFE